MCKYLFELCKHYSIWNNENSGILCLNCRRKHDVRQISAQILLYIVMPCAYKYFWSSRLVCAILNVTVHILTVTEDVFD